MNPKKKFTIIATSVLLFMGLMSFSLYTFYNGFRADEIIPLGTTQVVNLADNRADYPNSQIPKYEKLELTFDVNRTTTGKNINEEVDTGALNPFWPYDSTPAANTNDHPTAVPAGKGISVEGQFSQDNWDTIVTQPAFYYQEYLRDSSIPDRLLSNQRSWLYPSGIPVWKIRFAPQNIGQWQFRIKIMDASGETITAASAFEAVSALTTNSGFVKVSPTDSRYFETTDGQYIPFIGTGSFEKNLPEMEANYPKMKSMGINLIRPWWQGSYGWTGLFGSSGQGGDSIWNGLNYDSNNVEEDHLISAKLGSNDLWSSIPVKPNTNYRMSAVVKTVGITGDGICLAGLSTREPVLTGDNNWTPITRDFTTGANQYEITYAGVGKVNVTGGDAYVSRVTLREVLGENTYGPEIFMRPDFQSHDEYYPSIAWLLDKQIEIAKANNIYLKPVVEEYGDIFFGKIQEDGTWGDRSNNNVYANNQHASRTYQSYYWKYLIARYGYSTTIHSFELFNEGDPFNGNNINAALAFGNFIGNNDPNHHLSVTSNWHSFPPQFWAEEEMGYSDLHLYVGKGGSMGSRVYPGWDGDWSNGTNEIDPSGLFGFEKVDDSWTAKITQPSVGTIGGNGYRESPLSFQVGAIPGHTLEFSMRAKGENVGNNDYGRPQIYTRYQASGNDWVAFAPQSTGGQFQVPKGTYEWQPVTLTSVVPDDARIFIATIRTGNSDQGAAGTAWIDNVVIKDLTANKILNYNGDFELQTPESYDVVAGYGAYSKLTNSFMYNKPTIRGETGIVSSQRFSDQYKSYSYSGEDQLVVDDSEGIWWRKLVWSRLGPGGLIDMYWHKDVLLTKAFTFGKAFQNYISGIDFSNGKYSDITATTSNANLRAIGQKEVIDGEADKALIWLDNAPYTWKAVADNKFDINNSDLYYSSNRKYRLSSIARDGSGGSFYKCINTNNEDGIGKYLKNVSLSSPEYWESINQAALLSLLDMSSLNPALPSPISGTVTIPDMEDGKYKVEWWNTSTGVIENTELRQISGNSISLTVSNLVSDIAVKIYPFDFTDTPAPTTAPTPTDTTNYLELPVARFSSSWNMVSFPDTSGDITDDSFVPSGFKMRRYDTSTNSYIRAESSLMNLRPGQGYWLKIDDPNKVSSLKYPLSSSSSTEIAVTKGWNLLGNPYQSDLPLSNLMVKYKDGSTRSYSDAIVRKEVSGYVWSYEGSEKKYYFIAINPNNYKTDSPKSTVIKPFRGFWTIVKSDNVSAVMMVK